VSGENDFQAKRHVPEQWKNNNPILLIYEVTLQRAAGTVENEEKTKRAPDLLHQ
jgi:hypothetical protein